MKRLAATALVALMTTGCITRIEEAAPESTTSTTQPPATTSTTQAPVTTTRATQPPVTRPAYDYEADLEYLTAYCYSDCRRMDSETWENFLALATPEGLRDAVKVFANQSYAELDVACDEFWSTPDYQIIRDAVLIHGVADTNAMMTTFYYVCDT